ncbi:MAG: selenide, water dikinase SelD [Gammaproteobacteria bacterium]|nr:MAG: selenide, water dikinase SelD [Gammaproteobacteria bacterium]
MQPSPITDKAQILLAGGGHTHALLLRMWAMHPLPGVSLVLVSDQVLAPYSGMLPGLLAGEYTAADTHIDLQRLCQAAGATFIHARITGVDAQQQQLLLEDRPPLRYEWLSINTGITPSHISGSDEHAIALKPVSQLRERWQSFLAEKAPHHVAVIGGGAAGFEIVLAIHDALQATAANTAFTLLSAGGLLAGYPLAVQQRARQCLQDAGINLHEDFRVARIEAGTVMGETHQLEADAIFLATPGQAPAWIRHSGLACTDDGFIAVHDSLQSLQHDHVFAVGDVSVQVNHPRPRAGVYAVRQAPVLFHNLRAAIHGQPLKQHRPQQRFLSLLRCGPRTAIAAKGGLHAQGHWVWQWKDTIDRRFMRQFSELSGMTGTPGHTSGSQPMRCGGCGAKVGKTVLDTVLAQLDVTCDADTVIGLQQPDDAAIITPPKGMQLVQSVDGFRSFIDDPFWFGRIAAQHAISDLHAMGATPHSALAHITLPHGNAVQMENTLLQVMTGMTRTLHEEGMQLLGGHTAEGAELSVSLTVNGFIAARSALTKAGMKTGDWLVLSKPLGTGTLFAAHMQQRTQPEWIEAALAVMLQSNREASERLRSLGVHACTDVTGFGLLGHLLEMCEASHCGAELFLDQLPVLAGAHACLAAGIESTLAPENRRFAERISNLANWQTHPLLPLLFDPQTSGGLLASIPADSATEGFTVIGRVCQTPGVHLVL